MLETAQKEELPFHIYTTQDFPSVLSQAAEPQRQWKGKINVPHEASQPQPLSQKKIYEETFWISHEPTDKKINIQMWSKIKPSKKTEAED